MKSKLILKMTVDLLMTATLLLLITLWKKTNSLFIKTLLVFLYCIKYFYLKITLLFICPFLCNLTQDSPFITSKRFDPAPC